MLTSDAHWLQTLTSLHLMLVSMATGTQMEAVAKHFFQDPLVDVGWTEGRNGLFSRCFPVLPLHPPAYSSPSPGRLRLEHLWTLINTSVIICITGQWQHWKASHCYISHHIIIGLLVLMYYWTISLHHHILSYCTVLYHILYSFITYHIVSYCIAWQQAVLHHTVYFLLTFPHCGTNKGIFHYILFSSIASYPLSPNIFFSVQVQLFGTVNFKL